MQQFHRTGTKKSKISGTVAELGSDRALFARLYIASQQRECDLAEFVRLENQPAPPSLSDNGNIRQGDKYHLVECLQKDVSIPEGVLQVSAKVFDGPVVIHFP